MTAVGYMPPHPAQIFTYTKWAEYANFRADSESAAHRLAISEKKGKEGTISRERYSLF